MRILLIEDEADVARFISRGLTEQGYAVDAVASGNDALELASVNPYDAIILDLMLPGVDGLGVCRKLRASGSTIPILMLTARATVDDRISGLDAGADDYLPKPFEFGELLARLRALLRRGGATMPAVMEVGPIRIDTRSHRVTVGGTSLFLTTKEYSVLEYLARNAGRIVTREEISEHVWNDEFDPFSNLIEVYINRLRRQMEKVSDQKFIQTIRGAGYIFEPHGTANEAAYTPP